VDWFLADFATGRRLGICVTNELSSLATVARK
jgi:hypothetical protein